MYSAKVHVRDIPPVVYLVIHLHLHTPPHEYKNIPMHTHVQALSCTYIYVYTYIQATYSVYVHVHVHIPNLTLTHKVKYMHYVHSRCICVTSTCMSTCVWSYVSVNHLGRTLYMYSYTEPHMCKYMHTCSTCLFKISAYGSHPGNI